ncbi:hypothetical protein C8J57DRAFT_1570189 [Mycena rebaudengoi]|nr:hypothetical protein C8J57DRAFT_1570189 [Mycena rebaudengoi]
MPVSNLERYCNVELTKESLLHVEERSVSERCRGQKENRKRKASQTTVDPLTSELSLSKRRSRLSAPVPLRSEFGDVPGFSKVAFVFASVSISQDGIVKINWPDLKHHDESTTSNCLLQDTPFDQGKTKQVHKAIYDGLPWVAKCFCNIGAGEGQVDIQENLDQVVKEVTRLCKLGYFVTRFIGEARKQDVEIEQGIRVTDFKLGVEIVDNARNFLAATTVDENGDGIQVLFDVMTHTLDGSSGVGDHGKTGIQTFLKKHECANRCENLHLSRNGFAEHPDGEYEDS